MTKPRARSAFALDGARAFHEANGVRDVEDIDEMCLAFRAGARVDVAPLETQSSYLVGLEGERILCVSQRSLQSYRARSDIGHETGHAVLHVGKSEIALCTGEVRGGGRWQVETEAGDFSAEHLTPSRLIGPRCLEARPTLAHVAELASTFRMTLAATAIRYVEHAVAACAAVFAVNGRIKWSIESAPFTLRVVKGRALHSDSRAARCCSNHSLAKGASVVPTLAWSHEGRKPPRVELWEHTVPVRDFEGSTLTWLWHQPLG